MRAGVTPSWGRRLAGIEGLRAIAALSVMAEHTWLYAAGGPWLSGLGRWMPNLGNGLTLFFVLSGFLLYRPFAVAMAGAGRAPRIAAYARNRVLRIYPAYVVALLATGLVLQNANVLTPGGGRALGALHSPVTLAADLLLVQSFFPSTLFTGIDPARTLCAELTFYAALPLLAFAGYRVARRRSAAVRMLAPAVAMCAAGFGTVAVLVATGHPRAVHHGTWGEVFEQSLLPVAGLFGLGMGVAAIGVLGAQRWAVAPRALRRGALATAILSAGLGACLTAYAVVDPRVCHMVWGVAAAALILAVGLAPERRSRLVGAL